MWLEKLFSGVVRVLTPLGPRYLNASFSQRMRLIWIFRHFETVPVKVLSSRQRRMIESMYVSNGPVRSREGSRSLPSGAPPILGTLDERPSMPYLVPQRRAASPVGDSAAALGADIQH